jgi:molybdenum cofactor cytidylyltransferase
MIAAVLLAAGRARRFDGRQKLLAAIPHDGGHVPLVRLSVLGLMEAGMRHIVVVGGQAAGQVHQCLEGLDVAFVVNEGFATGMSSSLRIGVDEAVRRWPDSEGVLIALGDQPLFGTAIIEVLLECFATRERGPNGPAIIAPRFRGEGGNPVLFSRGLVPELLLISGDRGARAVVERDPARVRYVDFDRDAPLDVDSVGDLADLTENLRLP